ncbi:MULTISPECIES: hypothetical protein [Sphingobacterium]|uniref:hypothetical protein n=1 Tax=Sphingobacterium TaxID=28453 RepID=UPI00062758BF|nr:hypothetical protein [Sphingobacterium sp. Ag1]KKO90727.1 hypothetical protein AAW12_14250 [Sphingobacterium sp. Ag1]
MKRSNYYTIEVHIPYKDSYIVLATFDLGTCPKIVNELFSELLGSTDHSANRLLRIDLLLHAEAEIKIPLRTINCTLDELADNTRSIIKKAFRTLNLE